MLGCYLQYKWHRMQSFAKLIKPTFIYNKRSVTKQIKCVKLRKCSILRKTKNKKTKTLARFEIGDSETCQSWDRAMFTTASPLLLTVCKDLGTEKSSCWTFGREVLTHFCLIEDPSCSTILVYRYCILWFMMC